VRTAGRSAAVVVLADVGVDDLAKRIVVAELVGVLDQRVLLVLVVLDRDIGLVDLGVGLVDVDLVDFVHVLDVRGLIDLVVLGLDLGGLGSGGREGAYRVARSSGAGQLLEVEHGTAGGTGKLHGLPEIIEARAAGEAGALGSQFRLGQGGPLWTKAGKGACLAPGLGRGLRLDRVAADLAVRAIAMIARGCQKQMARADDTLSFCGAAGVAGPRRPWCHSLDVGIDRMLLRAAPHGALTGAVQVPGDKSISHRSLMLAGLAVGESRIDGLLEGADVMATAEALQALGVHVARAGTGSWQVRGCGVAGLAEPETVLDLGNAGTGVRLLMGILAGHGFTSFLTGDASLRRRPMRRIAEPETVLDLGNAGTGVRLLMGILAGHGFTSFLTGDASLRRRPMRRIAEPLEAMGAAVLARSGCRLPLALTGRVDLVPVTYHSPVASAQIKSAVLLAGLHAPGLTTVVEPLASRDHTERMLASMGARVTSGAVAGGWAVELEGEPELNPQHFVVPADPSSAAFPLVAALVAGGSAVTIRGISVNPLRTGLLATLQEMGGVLRLENERTAAGEPVADLVVEAGDLVAVDVPAERAPSMIDEYPILAVCAAFARGTTRMRGLAELRVKESDRLLTMANGLAAAGIEVRIEGDDLMVTGPVQKTKAVTIDAHHDHRIAMSFLVLGGLGSAAVTVAGAETILTSFPGFADLMNGLGAAIGEVAPGGQAGVPK
jgi:3-phosphoshikimate 1-carboxyvinyltransferase